MEEKTKLDVDFDNFTRSIESRREEEIRKIRVDIDALRNQALKLAESFTNSSSPT